MPISELIPMMDVHDAMPGTIVAIDMENPEDGSDNPQPVRFVGGVHSWSKDGHTLYLTDPDTGYTNELEDDHIVAGFWAPAGYRP